MVRSLDHIEKRGQLILHGVIYLLITHQLIYRIIFFHPNTFFLSAFQFFVISIFLWFTYHGYNWAKVVLIILLFLGIIGLFTQFEHIPTDSWLFTYQIIHMCINFITAITLLFSKSISEYMYLSRYRY